METAKSAASAIDSIAQSVIGLGDVFGFASSNIDKTQVFQFRSSTRARSDEENPRGECRGNGSLRRCLCGFDRFGTFDEVVTKVTSNGKLDRLAALFSNPAGASRNDSAM